MALSKKTSPKTAKVQANSNAMQAEEIKALIVNLVKRREDWEENQLRASNTTLYSMLADCDELFQQTQAFKSVRETVIETYDAKFGKGSSRLSILTRIVRLVFDVKNSARVFTYVAALKIAQKYRNKDQSIPQFFEANGGVEYVRRNQKPSSVIETEKSAKIQAVTKMLEEIAPFTQRIKINLPAYTTEKNAAHSFIAVLMREEADGSHSAILISKRQSTVNAMLSEYSSQTEVEREADLAARITLAPKPSRRASVAAARNA